MSKIQLKLDDREFRKALRDVAAREIPRAMAKALNRTAFEVLDAEKEEVRGAFDFAGPSTERFLSGRGSFRFDKATPSKLAVTVGAAPKTSAILEPHVEGGVFGPGDPERFVFDDAVATPVEVRRTARGRLPRRAFARTFRAGRVVLKRTARGVRVALALAPRIRLRPRFDFYGVVKRTARREFPKKARQEFEKIRGSR